MMLRTTTETKKKTATDLNQKADQAKFPSVRYFQVHYEHIHAELQQNRQAMAELQRQMAELQNHLGLAGTGQNPSLDELAKNRLQSKAKKQVDDFR